MLYEFGETLKEITPEEIHPDRVTAGILPLETLVSCNDKLFRFDPECVEQCQREESRFRFTVEMYPDYLFCILAVRNIGNVYGARDRVALFIRKNLLLLVVIRDKDDSLTAAFAEAAARVKPQTTSLERIICQYISRLVKADNGILEAYQKDVEKMEVQVENGATEKHFNADVLSLRRKLLIIRNYYGQFLELTDAMEANDADLFRSEKLHHFANLQRKLERLSNNTQLMRENLVQVREAYQSSLDFTTNQIMKVFTVITTIFLPLTLIVGWYGMNFVYMPELHWRFGYLGVIVLCIVVSAACIWLFKKKKLL